MDQNTAYSTMGIPDEITEQILDENSDTVAVFYTFLRDIFACTKFDITSFCDLLDQVCLAELREYIFGKLCIAKPELNHNELCQRRKKALIIDDIYILGHCLINDLEDRRLKNVIKKDNPKTNESSIDESKIEEDSECQENVLLKICAELKTEIIGLKDQLKSLVTRVVILEDEKSKLESRVEELSTSKSQKKSMNDVKTKKITVTAEVHRDKNGIPQMTYPDETITRIDDAAGVGDSSNIPFRHSNKERKNILKGKKITRDGQPESSVTHKRFKIEAASTNIRNVTRSLTHLIYIGHLSKGTNKESLTEHLIYIGVRNEDIADILQLKCRNQNERSFCVSINSDQGKDLIYDVKSNWPNGVRVRTYKPSRHTDRSQRHNKNWSDSHRSDINQPRPWQVKRRNHREGYNRADNQVRSYKGTVNNNSPLENRYYDENYEGYHGFN